MGRGGIFFSGLSRVRWGLPRGRRGENERSLEKRIEGVERWFLRKNEVLLKVKKKGKNLFRGKKKVHEVPKNGVL